MRRFRTRAAARAVATVAVGFGVFGLGAFASRSAAADEAAVAAFYKGRTISNICYTAAGSAYDLYARIINRHMGKYIPGNPGFIPRNMPGAGGFKLMEYVYSIAPKDGLTIAAISRGNAFEPMIGNPKAKYDAFKLTWLGSVNKATSLAISWHTNKVKTVEDLKRNELLIPGTGAGADSQIIPVAYNKLVGTKFKIVLGYGSITKAAFIMEQGEIGGIGYWSWNAIKQGHPGWIKDKKINLLFHTGLAEHPELKGVPRIREMVKNDIDRKALEFFLARELIGWPFVSSPDLPPERAQALRTAFAATMKDKGFLEDTAKSRLEVDPLTGAEMDAFLRDVAATPKEVIDRVRDVLALK